MRGESTGKGGRDCLLLPAVRVASKHVCAKQRSSNFVLPDGTFWGVPPRLSRAAARQRAELGEATTLAPDLWVFNIFAKLAMTVLFHLRQTKA